MLAVLTFQDRVHISRSLMFLRSAVIYIGRLRYGQWIITPAEWMGSCLAVIVDDHIDLAMVDL